MSLQELMKKHGSVGNIPDAEARAAGFEKVREGGGWRLRKIGEDSFRGLRDAVAKAYGLFVDALSHCDVMKLRRLWRIAEEYADHGSDLGGVLAALAENVDWERVVPWARACAAGESAAWFAQDPAREALRASFPEIDADVWFRGLDPWIVDVSQEREVSPRERIVQAEPMIRKAVADLLAELVQPDGLLKEAAAKLGCPARTDEVLMAALADEDRLRTFLAIAVARSSRKGSLKGEPGNGCFHVRRLQRDFSERPKTDASGNVFRFQMASGDLFADVDIGNDAGCCLGVYLKDRGRDGDDDFGEGFGKGVIPSMLLEPSVRFVAIYQGKRRMGLILLFLGSEAGGDPILVCNSIELSGRFEPQAGALVDAAMEWIERFRSACRIPRWAMGDTDYNTGLTHGRLREQGTVPVAKVFIPFFTESYRIHADIFQEGVKDFRGADVEGLLGIPITSSSGDGVESDIFAFIRARGGIVMEKPGTLRLSNGFRQAVRDWADEIRPAIAEIPVDLDAQGLPRFVVLAGYPQEADEAVSERLGDDAERPRGMKLADVLDALANSGWKGNEPTIRIVPLGIRRRAWEEGQPAPSDIPLVFIRVCAYAFVASVLGFPPEKREEAVVTGHDESLDEGILDALSFDGETFSYGSLSDEPWVAAEDCDVA